jgi:hypothetical protein
VEHFANKPVVVTEKLDGECTTMYRGHIHARSTDSRHHPSRNWVKQLHATVQHEIPEGWRICGENVYAQHSIKYDRLSTYFYVFAIFNEDNICLSWAETLEYCVLFGLQPVPTLYVGFFDQDAIRQLYPRPSAFGDTCEGYVLRICYPFALVAKFVRANHVQTSEHWMQQEVVPNVLYNHDNPQ